MSVDAELATPLDEALPESPLRDKLTAALPKCPADLHWKVEAFADATVQVVLETRKGIWRGSRDIKVSSFLEDAIVSTIANGARDLLNEVARSRILAELSGAYEGASE